VQTGEPSVIGSFAQDFAGVGFPFNGHNGSVSEDEIGKQSATDSGKQVHGSHFTDAADK
jgi:hypothetical protein